MGNPHVSIWSPDKYIKDIIWDDLVEASKYAHGDLLDIGCGKKPYKEIFASRVNKHIGIDNKSKEADIKGDFYTLDIKKRSYDTILCTQVLEHVEDPQRFLDKAYSALRPGGIVILTAPFIASLHEEPTDYFRFTRYSLEYLLKKSGFKIVALKEQGNWISAIGQEVIFYLESTFNRYGLKYLKRTVQILIILWLKMTDMLPVRVAKPKKGPINYIAIIKK